MALRWGFKREAHSLSVEVRRELGSSELSRLDPFDLLAHLGLPAIKLSEFNSQVPEAVKHFTDEDDGAFSAVTVFQGIKRLVVYNDSHHPRRQASDLAHEAAHALLHHMPSPALDENGCRYWDKDIEDEADFLGPALLVTESAALDAARRRIPIALAAERYGVSTKLMKYRLNITGAYKRVERTRYQKSMQKYAVSNKVLH